MEHHLSIRVEIDPEERHVRLVTSGHLTETNQQALYPLIRRARTLTCDTEVVIDLTSIEHLKSPALDLLCWEVEHDTPEYPARPVRFVLTGPPPASGPLAPHGNTRYRSGSTAWTRPGSPPGRPTRNSRGSRGSRRNHRPARPASAPAPPVSAPTPTTPSPDRAAADRSPVQIAALAYGAVFLLVGVFGFIPGITTGYDTMMFTGHHSQAMLLGLFQVSILHNIVHLLYGAAGLARARTGAGARAYLRWGGTVYLLLWLYGLVVDKESTANVAPFNTADDWLHFALGLTMVGLSFLHRHTHDHTITGR